MYKIPENSENTMSYLIRHIIKIVPVISVQENEILRKQNVQLSEENGKLVGHKNHKQKIEYLVKLKKDNTNFQEVTKIS